jgi:predicted RNA-binding protein associated with RNAse of E/G family
VDRVDGALDVAVAPDRSWEWKDEDEADECVRVGRLSVEQLALLRAEGERMIALAEAGRFPFDGTWTDFRPDPAWPAPTLPDGDY